MSSEVRTFALKMPNRGKGRFKGKDHKLHHHTQSVKSACGHQQAPPVLPCAKQLAPKDGYSALLSCVVLCYAMLCYAMLCYATLLYATLCYAMLCYAMLCCAMLCYAVLCCAMLCCAMLCYAVLCCAMLCFAMLQYTKLCYAVLCQDMLCRAVLCHIQPFQVWHVRMCCTTILEGCAGVLKGMQGTSSCNYRLSCMCCSTC